jgi:hypothetical protein
VLPLPALPFGAAPLSDVGVAEPPVRLLPPHAAIVASSTEHKITRLIVIPSSPQPIAKSRCFLAAVG